MDASVQHLVQQVVSSKVPLAASVAPAPLHLVLH
jgi:hypothetical protein